MDRLADDGVLDPQSLRDAVPGRGGLNLVNTPTAALEADNGTSVPRSFCRNNRSDPFTASDYRYFVTGPNSGTGGPK